MGYSLRADGDNVYTNIREYVLDAREDISKLPTDCRPGSDAIVIADGSVWFLDTSHHWVELKS